jgi:anaphase-promoting complex subunit 2
LFITSPDNNENLEQFEIFCTCLHKLNLIAISEEIFTEILFDEIEIKIRDLCKEQFSATVLPDIEEWVNSLVYEWLKLVICTKKDELNNRMFLQWKARIEYFVYETIAEIRISELFDIIVDYPDSNPAVLDLKEALSKTSQHSELINSLKKSFHERLLHPGATTLDILSQYLSTIKCLRVLDSTGITLDIVSEPIRSYLASREDTIRCIVTTATEDTESELYQELENNNAINMDNLSSNVDDTNEELDLNSNDWVPDPIDALASNYLLLYSHILIFYYSIKWHKEFKDGYT